jgi:hypothetical protein
MDADRSGIIHHPLPGGIELTIAEIHAAYASGLPVAAVIERVFDGIDAAS